MASINRVHRNFVLQLLDFLTGGGSALSGATLMATILDDTSTASTEWDSAGGTTGLADFATLGELSSATGKRETLTTIATALSGTKALLDFDDPLWAALAVGVNAPAHVLIYAEESGGAGFPADCWPVAIADASFTPDGTDFTALLPVNGLFTGESNP